MLSDVGALGASLWAISLAARPASGSWTYGWKRAEILSAAGNGISLLVVSALITVEAIQRLIHPTKVAGGAVLAVAILGMIVNVVAARNPGKGQPLQLERGGCLPAHPHRHVRLHRHRHRRHPHHHHRLGAQPMRWPRCSWSV